MSKAVESLKAARSRAAQQHQEATAALAALTNLAGPVVAVTRSRLQATLEASQNTLSQLDQVLASLAPPEERPDYAEAWGFVLQYSRQIDNIFWRSCRKYPDAEDRRQDFIERIVTRHASFAAYAKQHAIRDQTALVLNWLQSQLLASKTTARKRIRWREILVVGLTPREGINKEVPRGGTIPGETFFSILDLRADPDTAESLLEARSLDQLLQSLYAEATDAQQEAIQLFLEEASPATLKALGWTLGKRDQALASLRPLLLKQVA